MKKSLGEFRFFETWLLVMDQDTEWWPFGFLKPEPEQKLSQVRILLLSLLHALPITLLFAIATRLDGQSIDLWRFCFLVCVGAHVAFSIAFAIPWNRRARELRHGGPPNSSVGT